ncbi:unnamed protein product [Rhizoctonia solani]|uniref:Uncharacterized protein n=1 Tax=Rhizoctonia solani TaxID=456999 RepID=A0A8H3GVP8_9AGAM|nr:unnamed protein product [Rhizoctonia solani]CAE6475438.1 unnamed protein product [Rhizoctonia solani]
MKELNDSPHSPIEQWEKAGNTLVIAFKEYVGLCQGLAAEPLQEGANANDLISRIDSSLKGIHETISRQLNESKVALARARNKFASPLFRFPEEILSEIFMNFVYGNIAEPFELLSMEQEVWIIYRRLYTLLGVCATWKDILMARGEFWSVIPIISGPSAAEWRPFDLSLKRAGGSRLHLAASIERADTPDELGEILAGYGPRFRAIDINVVRVGEFSNVMEELLQHSASWPLSELSIRCAYTFRELGVPEEYRYIFPRNSPQQVAFASMVRNLVAFRICGAPVRWDNLVFSTQLVELRIQEVVLGYDDAILSFVQALSSAPNLRDLKIIAMTTFHNFTAQAPAPPSPITLPGLRSLLIENFYLNTLEYLVQIIAPVSYDFTLFPNHKIFVDNIPSTVIVIGVDTEETRRARICKALNQIPVDTLVISGYFNPDWLETTDFLEFLMAMPTLKTLRMNDWYFDKDLCQGITRINNDRTPAEDDIFPALRNLYLSQIGIPDAECFQSMIASHPLQLVVLEGSFCSGQSTSHEPWQENSRIVEWLRRNIPDLELRLVGASHAPELYSKHWRLW